MVWSSTRWKWVAVCAVLVAHQVAAQVEDGLLINGDFETPPPGGSSNFGVSDEPASIPSWKTNGTVEIISSGEKQGGMILIVPEGEHAVRLGNDAEISQEVKLEKGSIYSVTFSAARTCAQLESLNVSVPPASQTIDLQTLYSVQGWDTYAWAVQVEEDDVRVVFRNPGMEDDPTCGPIIDDIAVKKLFVPAKVKGLPHYDQELVERMGKSKATLALASQLKKLTGVHQTKALVNQVGTDSETGTGTGTGFGVRGEGGGESEPPRNVENPLQTDNIIEEDDDLDAEVGRAKKKQNISTVDHDRILGLEQPENLDGSGSGAGGSRFGCPKKRNELGVGTLSMKELRDIVTPPDPGSGI